jgi:hypothetical protein
VFGNELINDGFQFTCHGLRQPVDGQINSVICDSPVREIISADFLGSITTTNQVATGFCLFV